ncbi:hypothetical protein K501DRAFT_285101 [Backusella circina FSU 941]|nr:hypothetical protein K501DRAFT_285101 [Backusella circina FSU 941]
MNSAPLQVDNTRRKRLKVTSACGECRRKKTKCNGEKPCSGCIKAKVDCNYSNSPKARSSAPQQRTEQRSLDTISSIEHRLGVIEDILHVLLLNSSTASPERNMQPHSGPYYGEMYPRHSTESGYRRQQQWPREKRHYDTMSSNHGADWSEPSEAVRHHPFSHSPSELIRLPPLGSLQPPLSESSSTSTASSTCSSNDSPKSNTIQNLLNESDTKIKYEEKQGRPSAFYKPTAAGTGR